MAVILVGILTTKPLIFLLYKCEVTKLGSKAGNFLSGKRGGVGRERQRKIEKEREKERVRHKEREGERES
jgi:hypothetical protein